MKHHHTLFVTVIALMLGYAAPANADSLSEIKASMSQRLAKVVALKQDGSVGENNLGYLTARKPLSSGDAKLVADENADRAAVYAAIAGKTKASAAAVGKTRAAGIRSSAPSGTWVQLPSGGWEQIK